MWRLLYEMSSVTDGQTLTSTFLTELPSKSEHDISVPNLVIPIVVLVIILGSCGIVACYIMIQRQKSNAGNYQLRVAGEANLSFNGYNKQDISESNDTTGTRESGTYASYDAISVDMRNMEIHYNPPKENNETTIQRQSKESTTSGAYMSFDDIEYYSLE